MRLRTFVPSALLLTAGALAHSAQDPCCEHSAASRAQLASQASSQDAELEAAEESLAAIDSALAELASTLQETEGGAVTSEDAQSDEIASALSELESVLRDGDRGYLGIRMIQDEGLLVDSVMSSSGAERAGLQSGDRILSINGKSALDDDILDYMQGLEAGDSVNVTYQRGDQKRETTIELMTLDAIQGARDADEPPTMEFTVDEEFTVEEEPVEEPVVVKVEAGPSDDEIRRIIRAEVEKDVEEEFVDETEGIEWDSIPNVPFTVQWDGDQSTDSSSGIVIYTIKTDEEGQEGTYTIKVLSGDPDEPPATGMLRIRGDSTLKLGGEGGSRIVLKRSGEGPVEIKTQDDVSGILTLAPMITAVRVNDRTECDGSGNCDDCEGEEWEECKGAEGRNTIILRALTGDDCDGDCDRGCDWDDDCDGDCDRGCDWDDDCDDCPMPRRMHMMSEALHSMHGQGAWFQGGHDGGHGRHRGGHHHGQRNDAKHHPQGNMPRGRMSLGWEHGPGPDGFPGRGGSHPPVCPNCGSPMPGGPDGPDHFFMGFMGHPDSHGGPDNHAGHGGPNDFFIPRGAAHGHPRMEGPDDRMQELFERIEELSERMEHLEGMIERLSRRRR